MDPILEAKVTLLVLLAAFVHACWNALVKSGREPLLAVAGVSAVAMVISAGLIPWLPVPARASWPYLAGGVVTHNGFKIFLVLAYRGGDLSRVYPLARGSAPLLVALFSGLAVGEFLGAWGYVGVAVVSLGLASLTFEGGVQGRAGRTAVVFAFFTGVFIGAYTLIDGMGVRLSGHSLAYGAWLFALDGVPMVLLAWALRRHALRDFLRQGALTSLAAGSLSLFGYFVIIWALNQRAMAPIAALRETGVIFAALIGRVVLKEPFGQRRVVAAVLVCAGVVLLHLGG